MCNCGHLACFHLQTSEAASPGKNRDEIEMVKQRIGLLEQQSDVGDGGAMDRVVSRLSNLEEMVDKAREEFHAEIKGSYRNISGAWQLIEQLQKQVDALEGICRTQDRQLDRAGKELDDVRNRQLELLDSDESLEERIEKLESAEVLLSPPLEEQPATLVTSHVSQPSSSVLVAADAVAADALLSSPPDLMLDKAMDHTSETELATSTSTTWTVHVSLLPSKEQQRPFEKDSTAYKRSLSRGMQRMVAIDPERGETFSIAVTRSFRHVLQGRPWELLCRTSGASHLHGLQLQSFEPKVSLQGVDRAFLEAHCASLDVLGKIEAVYIAPSNGTLPWSQLKQLPVHVEGLESSWQYEAALDWDATSSKPVHRVLPFQQTSPATEGSIQAVNPLKRTISDLSKSTCITSMSSAEPDQGRAKMARSCMTALVGVTTGSERWRAV